MLQWGFYIIVSIVKAKERALHILWNDYSLRLTCKTAALLIRGRQVMLFCLLAPIRLYVLCLWARVSPDLAFTPRSLICFALALVCQGGRCPSCRRVHSFWALLQVCLLLPAHTIPKMQQGFPFVRCI